MNPSEYAHSVENERAYHSTREVYELVCEQTDGEYIPERVHPSEYTPKKRVLCRECTKRMRSTTEHVIEVSDTFGVRTDGH